MMLFSNNASRIGAGNAKTICSRLITNVFFNAMATSGSVNRLTKFVRPTQELPLKPR